MAYELDSDAQTFGAGTPFEARLIAMQSSDRSWIGALMFSDERLSPRITIDTGSGRLEQMRFVHIMAPSNIREVCISNSEVYYNTLVDIFNSLIGEREEAIKRLKETVKVVDDLDMQDFDSRILRDAVLNVEKIIELLSV